MEENIIAIWDTKPFYFNFDWPKDVDENLTHEIRFIIKTNKSLAKNEIKNETGHCPSISKETTFVSTKNSKTNESHNFFFIKCQKRLGLRSSNKHVVFKTYLFITRGKL